MITEGIPGTVNPWLYSLPYYGKNILSTIALILYKHMTELLRGYFDVDGTLLAKGEKKVSQPLIDAISNVPFRGLNTNRGLLIAEEAVPFTLMNMPNIFLSGGEIWKPNGEFMHAFPLATEERRAIADVIVSQGSKIKLGRFYREGQKQATLLATTPELQRKYIASYEPKHILGSLTASPVEFAKQLIETPASMVILRIDPDAVLDYPEDLKSSLRVDRDEKDIVMTRRDVTKGSSLLWVCQELNIDIHTLFTAGDSTVDTSMFRHSFGISVGPTLLPYAQVNVENPAALGNYLQELYS
jgi:hydroxymethylpyrimidine pyrophosphatase-like HAD family hydrolase